MGIFSSNLQKTSSFTKKNTESYQIIRSMILYGFKLIIFTVLFMFLFFFFQRVKYTNDR